MISRKIVLKLGGSLMYKGGLDLNTEVLNMFKDWYKREKHNYELIVIVVGGGRLSREVGSVIKPYVKNDSDLHSVGMELTQTNAHILKGYLGDKDVYNPQTLGEAYEFLMTGKGILISGGLRHGWSTDMDAAVFADVLGLKKVYKLSDVEGLYTADPKIDDKAKLIKDITWARYRKMFGLERKHDEHSPNLHIPISAECAVFAQNKGLSFFVSGGKLLLTKKKLENVFESGSLIHA
ncbi:MAG: Uridylate kinase [candidate division WS6 bacterium GW2011_GWF2_39_15]|uniref:Uridylate kinase n=1 Tax=candidate division WS6 bacterium GW2011_GWF2_39_15 TaxID=1619100 RepID=A0A0G0MYS2_9BACT|nr:MAG: Uridylate kinase [candidate division WS6 bacterium GW2011_GWF2_39_15]